MGAVDGPLVGAAGWVAGRWGEDLASGASDVDAGAESACLVVADFVWGEQIDVAAAGRG